MALKGLVEVRDVRRVVVHCSAHFVDNRQLRL